VSDETITIPKVTAQILFDALTTSMDFGSGFLDSDDVTALRELAVAIGVDPATATPGEFEKDYPHRFDDETNRLLMARMYGLSSVIQRISVNRAPYTTIEVDHSRMPDHVPCKVGSWGRKCLKPETDPIHQEQP